MARPRKVETLDQKIEKAELKVQKAEEMLKQANIELENLRNKKDSLKKEEILNAINNSDKSIEDIISFLKGEAKTEE